MYQEDSNLTDTLAAVSQTWVDEFRKAWGLDAKTPPNGMDRLNWELLTACDQIAGQIVSTSRTLERNSSNLDERLNLLRDKLGLDIEQNTFFTHLLEAHLVVDLEDELDRMRRRALKLIRYLVDVKSERVRLYLERVGACYLRGLKTETVLMCGAVVDAALQESLDDENVRGALNKKCGRYVSLGNRIEFMKISGHWDESTVTTAFRLADERNNAIHTAPILARDVDEVMKDLVLLLSGIPGL